MRTHLGALAASLLVGGILVSRPVSSGTVVPVPLVPGVGTSSDYSVTADGNAVAVGKETFNGGKAFSYVSFTMAGTVSVAVTVSGSFTSYSVHPRDLNVASSRSGNTITF